MKHIPSVAFFLLGLVAGMCLVSYSKFTWKNEVGVTDLCTILLGVVIALFLQSKLASKSSGEREEKKILLDQLQRIVVQADMVRESYVQSMEGAWADAASKTASANLRLLANTVFLFSECAKASDKQCDASELQTLRDLYFNFKASVTSGPYPSKPLPAEFLMKAETCYQTFLKHVVGLQFRINKC